MINALLRIAATFGMFLLAAAIYCIACPLDAYAADDRAVIGKADAFVALVTIMALMTFAYLIGKARGEYDAFDVIRDARDDDAPIRAEDFARKSQQ